MGAPVHALWLLLSEDREKGRLRPTQGSPGSRGTAWL